MHILDYHSHTHGAKVLYAIAESVVPKIAVLIRKAYGSAKPTMGIDKDIGIDRVYAWPTGESAVMGAEAVADVIYGKKRKTDIPNGTEIFHYSLISFYCFKNEYRMSNKEC